MPRLFRFAARLSYFCIFISLLAGFAIIQSHGQSEPVQDRSVNNSAVESGASPEQTELAVDDGTFETTLGRSDGGLSWRVNRLTPASYPATINAVSVFFRSNSRLTVGDPLTIVFAANPGGGANINGIQLQEVAGTVQALSAFNVYNIPPLTINSGDFVVGYKITHADGVFPFSLDTTPPSQRRSYRSLDGVAYTINDDISQNNVGNYGIRARLQPAGPNGLFIPGDVFVAVTNGQVQWRRANGTLVQTLNTGEGSIMAGMAFDKFDKDANLYATSFETNKVYRFSPTGQSLGTFGSGYNCFPESIAFDRAGNVYVGQAGPKSPPITCNRSILKFDAAGNRLATLTPATERRGTDWIELAEDQCTLFYTSEGKRIKRFNVCTNTQLPDFVIALPGSIAYALRLLPNGGLIVADTEVIVRLDAAGNEISRYDASGENSWFAINLDPDGTSFWSAGLETGNVYKFDLESKNQLLNFNTGVLPTPDGEIIGGLAIFGEIVIGPADLAITKTSSPNPVEKGSNLTYTMTVTNKGAVTANSVRVTDNLPAGTTFVSCNATGGGVCGGAGNNRTITFNSLASSASATITLVATANCSGGNRIINTATVTSANSGNNSATTSSTVNGCDDTCINVAIPANLSGSVGETLTVPINVSDTTGKNALSYDAVLTFDPSVLRLRNPPFDRSGTLSANLTVTTNSPAAGRLNISGFSQNALTGQGVLLNLKFDVIAPFTTCSDLKWTSYRFNEGTPCSTTSNGRVCGGTISGAVSYCAANPSKAVPGVTITAAGSPQRASTTDSGGKYQVSDLGGGPYTLTPAKTSDANGITSFDAAQIAQHVVQIITLTPCQQAAADTSGNGEITSFDAAFIAQYVVGITNQANRTGTWKFLPPTRTYPSLNGNQAGQNFDAVLIGELTGNWMSGDGNALLTDQSMGNESHLSPMQVGISLPSVTAAAGSSITIPITVGDLTGHGFISFDFDLTYDANVLQAPQLPTDATDTLSRNLTITANTTSGRLRVSGFGAQPMAGAGTLLKLKFTLANSAGIGTALLWQRFLFNETPQTNLAHGRVNAALAVTSVSAASFKPEVAAESIAAAFGSALATTTSVASVLPLPTSLAGTTVKVRDSAGAERLAPLFFVAPTQVNYQIPPGTAAGVATVTITSGDGTSSLGTISIANVAPSLFAANGDGQGVAAGVVLRIKPDGTQSFEPASRFDPSQSRFVSVPIDLGPEGEQVFLILSGSGFRNRSSLPAVSCQIGGVSAEVFYAGAAPGFVGLDQSNVRLPRSLAGRGEVDVVLIVDGRAANIVRLNVR